MEEVVLNERIHKSPVESFRVDGVLCNISNHLDHEKLVALGDDSHFTYGLFFLLLKLFLFLLRRDVFDVF